MKVKRGQNRERNGLGGMVASAALMAAALAAFALFSVQFGNRTGARDQETLKRPSPEPVSSAMPLRDAIRQVWNIWKKITES